MAFKYLLLVLPALALARIDIEISGKFNGDQSKLNVHWTGSESGIITDVEKTTFQLNEENLKKGVNEYFGRRPDDAFVRSPTPWGDLYQTYNWDQVMTTLVPKNGRILKIESYPEIVMEQIFENNASEPQYFNVGVTKNVRNTLLSKWTKSGQISVGENLVYDIDVETPNRGEAEVSYTTTWGSDFEKSQETIIGAVSNTELLLQPGQSVLAELHATRGVIQVEIDYEASLSGFVAVNYNESYKGHQFWGLDVNAVMSNVGLRNKMMSKEVIEIVFYSNSSLVVNDRESGTKMLEVSF